MCFEQVGNVVHWSASLNPNAAVFREQGGVHARGFRTSSRIIEILQGYVDPPGELKISYYDGLQFADAKYREQFLPPTAFAGFNSLPGAAKDRSPIAKIDPDGAFVGFKEMVITPMEANHDVPKVACPKIGVLAIERAACKKKTPSLVKTLCFRHPPSLIPYVNRIA
jgi:hypothetical protein